MPKTGTLAAEIKRRIAGLEPEHELVEDPERILTSSTKHRQTEYEQEPEKEEQFSSAEE